jgi:DNA-binding Lrp family transcriptional regulator
VRLQRQSLSRIPASVGLCASGTEDGPHGRLDAVDRKILAELQRDGRLTITELADRVRLSVSPCHRRLRALENSGAISGYRAQLNAHALGLTFEALVFVTMRASDRSTLEMFEESVTEIPNVVQAQRLFGAPTISCVSSRAISRLFNASMTNNLQL